MTTDSYQPAMFKEVQRFRQLWLWVLMITIGVVAAVAIVLGASHDKPGSSDSFAWVFAILIAVGTPMLIYAIKMITTVTRDTITIRYFPIYTKRIPIRDITSCEPRQYHPIREYGGWGIKVGFSRGWAYTVSGDLGVQLVLSNGSELLIGSQRHLELATTINSVRNH